MMFATTLLPLVLGLSALAGPPGTTGEPVPEGVAAPAYDRELQQAQVPAGPAATQPSPFGGVLPGGLAFPGFPGQPSPFPSPLALSPNLFFPPGATADAGAGEQGLTSLERLSPVGIPQMLGDMSPVFGRAYLAPTSGGGNALRLPWVRGYKMADNQSPRPLDRVYAVFNFFNDLNTRNLTAPGLHDVKIYREYFGVEKTFFGGNASVNLRLPVNSITAQGTGPGVASGSTAVGDLSILTKFALWQNRSTGDIISAGLGIGTPTGPSSFAGASFAKAANPPFIQPFVGFIKTFGNFYAQGFSAIDVPFDTRVVTIYYNDLGMGYFFRSADPDAFLSGVAPSMEVHVNTPLNHRNVSANDPTATFDIVNLTFGLTAVTRQRTMLSVGLVEPVTGPRPFSGELIVMLNWFFGRSRPAPAQPPFVGGG
jgi:hypothetical protein